MRDISDELNNGGEKYDYTTLIVSLKSSLKKLKMKINMMFMLYFVWCMSQIFYQV